jgi:DNA mismatch repair protein MutS
LLAKNAGQGLTPALRQWFSVKEEHPEAVLFFQMGDFYELFFEDATLVAPLLDLTLTSRQKLDNQPVPMCGVPLSAGESYISRLAQMGHKIAVCEQVGPLPPKHGLADRVVRRVVTPGTILAQDSQTETVSRYVAAIHCSEASENWALGAVELSTGDFILGQWNNQDGLWAELSALEPSEIIIAQGASQKISDLVSALGVYTTSLPDSQFDGSFLDHWKKAFGEDFEPEPEDQPLSLAVGSAVLGYCLALSPGSNLEHLARPRKLWSSPYLGLDEAAIRNLELIKSLRDSGINGTILKLISLNVTPMGGRLLRDWLTRPLYNRAQVQRRHEAVENLLADSLWRENLLDYLQKTLDLERALSRLTLGRGTVRDLVAVQATLSQAGPIKDLLALSSSELLKELGASLNPLPELLAKLSRTLTETPSAPGDPVVRSGLSPRLDELRDLESGGKQRIAALEARERARTGINNLKVGFNKIFGYFLEVTKSNLASVPGDWQRKQTVSGGERFVTPELKEWEERIVTAGENRTVLEERILENLKKTAAKSAKPLKELAMLLAQIDALAALAGAALKYNWIRPTLTEDDLIDIKGGRHPVVEQSLAAGETFVANDLKITPWERLLIITGPNMAGKSTILRQTAIIVILNQMGSFVPAEQAALSMRDQVFTRVGASDDLARGQSTFMVEMSETARILKKATPRSLVILDEVGRGTSTFDGLAIAWAVAEYLHDLATRGVPTLFATHYHELVELAQTKPLTRNYNVTVKKWGQNIVFLRRLAPGGASKSYGLAVAALAGLPDRVIRRSGEVLADLTRHNKQLVRPDKFQGDLLAQAGLHDDPATALVREISNLKIEELTPLEALNLLTELKTRANESIS